MHFFLYSCSNRDHSYLFIWCLSLHLRSQRIFKTKYVFIQCRILNCVHTKFCLWIKWQHYYKWIHQMKNLKFKFGTQYKMCVVQYNNIGILRCKYISLIPLENSFFLFPFYWNKWFSHLFCFYLVLRKIILSNGTTITTLVSSLILTKVVWALLQGRPVPGHV